MVFNGTGIFLEEQKYPQWVIPAASVVFAIGLSGMAVQLVRKNGALSGNYALVAFWVAALLFCIGFLYFFRKACLTTQIDSNGVTFNYNVYRRHKTIPWSAINTIQVVKYQTLNIVTHGNVSLEKYTLFGTPYYFSGPRWCVNIQYRGNNWLTLGTRQPQQLKAFLKSNTTNATQ